jgi:hypothetical protein
VARAHDFVKRHILGSFSLPSKFGQSRPLVARFFANLTENSFAVNFPTLASRKLTAFRRPTCFSHPSTFANVF